jgi:hypothetical protein
MYTAARDEESHSRLILPGLRQSLPIEVPEDAGSCRLRKGTGVLRLHLELRERFLANADGPATQSIALVLKFAAGTQRIDQTWRDVENVGGLSDGKHETDLYRRLIIGVAAPHFWCDDADASGSAICV